jgi:hypothetical protein
VTIRASGIIFPYSLGLDAYSVRRALIWFADFLHYLQYYFILFGFVPTNQYPIPRVRPRQEPLHIDHAWIRKM